MVQYRITNNPNDMPRIVDLEVRIWGISERHAFPPVFLSLVGLHGGAVFIAEDGDRLVGFCFCSPVRRNNEIVLWSYIAGVHPNYQSQGIGRKLKQMQFKWAQENGYSKIHWTFDPMQPSNANFNLNQLGVVVREYHENLYGEMTDAINAFPLPSDRLEVTWLITPPDNPFVETINSPYFLVENTGGSPTLDLDHLNGDLVAIALPERRDKRLQEWQLAIRRAFQYAFSHRYEAFQFVRNQTNSYYLLRPIV